MFIIALLLFPTFNTLCLAAILLSDLICNFFIAAKNTHNSSAELAKDTCFHRYVKALQSPEPRIVLKYLNVPVYSFKFSGHGGIDPIDFSATLKTSFATQVDDKSFQSLSNASQFTDAEYVTLPYLCSLDPDFLFDKKSEYLFIRPQYITFAEYLLAHKVGDRPPTPFVLDGNSGSGKSMFIYYFMYVLHHHNMSFKGINCGIQSRDRIYSVVVSSHQDTFDWIITDSIRYDSQDCSCILSVSSDLSNIMRPKNGRKGDELHKPYNYICMSPWSYVETCAAAFCPINRGSLSEPSFSTVHPLYVLSHFIALRSTMRELLTAPIHYTGSSTHPEDHPSAVPNSVFLKFLSSDQQAELGKLFKSPTKLPLSYICPRSCYDLSVNQIYSMQGKTPGTVRSFAGIGILTVSLPIDLTTTHFKSHKPSFEPLTSTSFKSTPSPDWDEGVALADIDLKHFAAYIGIATGMAASDTTNPAFHLCFIALLPFIRLSVQNLVASCSSSIKSARVGPLWASPAEFGTISTTGAFAFRQYPQRYIPDRLRIVSESTIDDVNNSFPQHLSICGTSTDENSLYDYFLRSPSILYTAVYYMQIECGEASGNISDLLKNVFASSGTGFCYEHLV
jgi:hypothetical protein